MHIQARANTRTSHFSDDDHDHDDGEVAISATYRLGVLSDMLRILAEYGFNLRTATGRKVEFGGEFAFWVDARAGVDTSHDEATQRAADVLAKEGYDTHTVEVHSALLDDVPGALKRFVDEVTAAGLLIEEICVGTPEPTGGIPVQAFTVQAGGGAVSQS